MLHRRVIRQQVRRRKSLLVQVVLDILDLQCLGNKARKRVRQEQGKVVFAACNRRS